MRYSEYLAAVRAEVDIPFPENTAQCSHMNCMQFCGTERTEGGDIIAILQLQHARPPLLFESPAGDNARKRARLKAWHANPCLSTRSPPSHSLLSLPHSRKVCYNPAGTGNNHLGGGMPLRSVQIFMPHEHGDRVFRMIQEHEPLSAWRDRLSQGCCLVNVLLPTERTEALLDALEQEFSSPAGVPRSPGSGRGDTAAAQARTVAAHSPVAAALIFK